MANNLGRNERQRPSVQETIGSRVAQKSTATGDRRHIFLLVWRSMKFKAHWAIFIPDANDKTYKKGKYVHVHGSVNQGFKFQIVRNWNIDLSKNRPDWPLELGSVRAEHVQDVEVGKSDGLLKDAAPFDTIERIMARISAPSASMKKASDGGNVSHRNQDV